VTALYELPHGTIELTGQAVRVLGYYDHAKNGDNEELEAIRDLEPPSATGSGQTDIRS